VGLGLEGVRRRIRLRFRSFEFGLRLFVLWLANLRMRRLLVLEKLMLLASL